MKSSIKFLLQCSYTEVSVCVTVLLAGTRTDYPTLRTPVSRCRGKGRRTEPCATLSTRTSPHWPVDRCPSLPLRTDRCGTVSTPRPNCRSVRCVRRIGPTTESLMTSCWPSRVKDKNSCLFNYNCSFNNSCSNSSYRLVLMFVELSFGGWRGFTALMSLSWNPWSNES